MFAGIVHEVGGFYLLSRAEEFPGLLEGDAEDWAEYGEKIIGRGVLKKLDVPAPVLTAVESLWTGVGANPPATLGDLLFLANQLAPVASPLHPGIDVALEQASPPRSMVNLAGSTSRCTARDSRPLTPSTIRSSRRRARVSGSRSTSAPIRSSV